MRHRWNRIDYSSQDVRLLGSSGSSLWPSLLLMGLVGLSGDGVEEELVLAAVPW